MSHPKVAIKTNLGTIEIELWEDSAPISVENFLSYVDDGFYNGTIFHRVIKDFMIQGGGFDENMSEQLTEPPIKNEATNRVPNNRGTLALARTGVVDSATSQFFINLKDNDFLNHSSPTPQGFGYCVFGTVTSGMDIVDMIAEAATGNHGHHGDVPIDPIIMETVSRI